MQSVLKDIKEKVRQEDFLGALSLCEAIQNEFKSFAVFSIMGTCAIQVGDKKKAIEAFEYALASSDAGAPGNIAQSQKVWKVF